MIDSKYVYASILIVAMLIGFVYGIAVGRYNVFPINELLAVKQYIFGNENFQPYQNNPHYSHKISFFEELGRNDYNVVFVGDSITAMSEWHEVFPQHNVANRGINGDTSEGVLSRIETISLTNAKTAFIMIGVNDIGKGIDVDIIVENYISILQALKNDNIEPIVQSTLYTNGRELSDNKIIAKLNAKMRQFCSENQITYIDLNVHLALDGKLNPIYSGDGLHINGQGYKVWSSVIADYIEK